MLPGSTKSEPSARDGQSRKSVLPPSHPCSNCLQPTLKGALVTLRPLQEQDWEALYAAAADPLIWEQHPESDRWTEPVFRRYFEGAIASGGGLAVLENATGEVIGSSRFCNALPHAEEIEIGYTFLARRYWGGRYNREMKRLMLDHILGHYSRVVFVIGPANLRSRTAVERLGAVEIPERAAERGVVYTITQSQWETLRVSLL
jgi:RimJ/RimL family protein N-acetyltransferase